MSYCINPFFSKGVIKIDCDNCKGKTDDELCSQFRETYHTVKQED